MRLGAERSSGALENRASRAPSAVPGVVIQDRYRIGEQIGRGASATVWSAEDLLSNKQVAIKILDAGWAPASAALARSLEEAHNAATIDHPHSVRMIDHGQTPDGAAFLVMERLDGRTLATLLRSEGPLPLLRAVRIFAQILDAVGAAHRAGVLHRDLKPSNIMLIDGEGDGDFVKVCDFGLAKRVDPDDGGTDDEVTTALGGADGLCGTPEYMAPEQVRGGTLDARADLYAVSAMLFEVLLGRPPFVGRSTAEVIGRHLSAAPPRLADVRPELEIPSALDSLILRGLAKDPSDRPCSAEVYRAELLQVARDRLRRRGRRRAGDAVDVPTLRAGGGSVGRSSWFVRHRWRVGTALVAMSAMALAMTAAKDRDPPVSAARMPAPAPTRAASVAAPPAVASHAAVPASPSPDPARSNPTRTKSKRRQQSPDSPPEPWAAEPVLVSPADTSTVPAPSDGEALLRRANELLVAGDLAEACATGERAVAQGSRHASAHRFLARCYMRLRRPNSAREHYETYLRMAPQAEDAAFVRTILRTPPP